MIIKKQVALDCVFYLNTFKTVRCNMTQQNYHIGKMVFLKNQKHAACTIAHLCEVMVHRNVMTKTDCKLQK
jgi:hypothetical protein